MGQAEHIIYEQHNVLVVERVFKAPRERVFKAWSDPEKRAAWWGTKGFTTPVCTIDFRVGGTFHICTRGPEGKVFWLGGTYQEIAQNERIVYSDYLVDEEGKKVTAEYYGMSSEWPDETLITVTFEDHDGKTKQTLHHTDIPLSKEEKCTIGWNEIFDRLAEYVEKA